MGLQFVAKARTVKTKPISKQSSHEVCASEDISQINLKIYFEGYNWSRGFKYNAEKDGQ